MVQRRWRVVRTARRVDPPLEVDRADEESPSTESEPIPVHPKEFRRLLDEQKRVRRSTDGGAPAGDEPTPVKTARLIPRRKLGAGEVVSKIREGFDGLNDVLSGIDEKLAGHNETSGQLAHSIEKLPEFMERLPEASEKGRALLERVSHALDDQTRATHDMVAKVHEVAEGLREIPQAVDRLNERLNEQEADRARLEDSVSRMQEDNRQLQRETLEEFRRSQEATHAQQRLEQQASREVTQLLLERTSTQGRILMALLGVLIVAAAVTLVQVLMR